MKAHIRQPAIEIKVARLRDEKQPKGEPSSHPILEQCEKIIEEITKLQGFTGIDIESVRKYANYLVYANERASNNMLGFVSVSACEDYLVLGNAGVRPRYQRMGILTILNDYLEKNSQGFQTFRAQVMPSNLPSISSLKKHKFILDEVETRTDFIGDRQHYFKPIDPKKATMTLDDACEKTEIVKLLEK
jgi:ribosomal protein S18 acetylase RimI-like enzyme